MVTAKTELVTFNSGPLTGTLTAEAAANAVAEFNLRRGVRVELDARAKIEGDLQAKLATSPDGMAASAAVTASIGAALRVAFAAQLDVNGLFAEVSASAEARAQIRGDITMSGQQLFDALSADTAKLPRGALVPAIALLKEANVHAEVFADAYFAVRAQAAIMVSGSVIPRPGGLLSGIVVSSTFGYAWGWGAGWSAKVTCELPDAARAASGVADAVVDEAVRLLPAGTSPLVVSVLKLVLPLAASAAVAAGQALGAPQVFDPGAGPGGGPTVTDAVLSEIRRHGLTLVLGAVLAAGRAALAELIDVTLDAAGVPAAVRDAGKAVVAELQPELDLLTAAKSVPAALPHIVKVCDRLATFAEGSAAQVDGFADLATGLTVTVAAGGVLAHVLGGDPLADFPAGSRQRILGQRPGPLAVEDLVGYLVDNVVKLGPGTLSSVDWLADVLGCAVLELVPVLWKLGQGQFDAAARRKLATDLVHALTQKSKEHLSPFLANLPAGELKDLAAFMGPLLDVIDHALVPALSASNAQEAARARDELDVLLTGDFGAVIVRCLDVIVRPFFKQGQQQLTNVANHIERGDPAFADFFSAANSAQVVFRISPAVVAESLRQMAGILDLAEETTFESTLTLLRSFVLLSADSDQRRLELDKLAGGDGTRLLNRDLRTDLLEAMFLDSTKFALGLVIPSLVMSGLIALDQGPVSVVVLYRESQQIVESTVAAIGALVAVGTTVSDVLVSLRDGKLTPEELRALGEALRGFIGAGANLVKEVLDLVKELSYPAFVLATGGLGLFTPVKQALFDEFFELADELVDAVAEALADVTDGFIEAIISVAQDIGLFDTGAGEDLGTLGEAVRQRSLGAPNQPDLLLVDGSVPLSRAELATLTTNAAFANPAVRAQVRAFHERAVAQAHIARQCAAVLLPNVEAADAAKAALETRLEAQQRDDGFQLGVSIEGIVEGSATGPRHLFRVVITGAGPEFIDGFRSLVRVEVGGWPVPIDRDSWQVAADGTLRGHFEVVSDISVGAAHPFVGEGFVTLAPQQAVDGPNDDDALRALHQVVREHSPLTSGAGDPATFLAQPATRGGPATKLTADMFVAPVLTGGPVGNQRFPGVLSFDRQQMVDATVSAKDADALRNLPGSVERAYVSTADEKTLTLLRGLTVNAAAGQTPLDMVARVRPGYTTVTATVRAAPKAGQTDITAPAGQAAPTWFVVAGLAQEVPAEPEPTNIALFAGETAVPKELVQGESVTVQLTMTNTGTATWTSAAGYKLARVQQQLPDAFVELPHDVAPQQQVTFTIKVDAPPAGGLVFQWQMTRIEPTRQELFGDPSPQHQVALVFDSAANPVVAVPAKIPLDLTLEAKVTVPNNGTSTWTSERGYRLKAIGDEFGAKFRDLPAPVPPGNSAVFTLPIAPPPQPSVFSWRMTHHDVEFGVTSTPVTVTAVERSTCFGLRTALAELKTKRADLQEKIKNGPRGGGAPKIELAKIDAEIAEVEQKLKDQGCDRR